jgi:hypothetical protein
MLFYNSTLLEYRIVSEALANEWACLNVSSFCYEDLDRQILNLFNYFLRDILKSEVLG